MDNDVTPVTPASSDLEQEKEERPRDDLLIDDYDKTVADSFPASDPPAY